MSMNEVCNACTFTKLHQLNGHIDEHFKNKLIQQAKGISNKKINQ